MEGPLDLTTISSCTSRQFRRDEPDLRFKKPSTMQYPMYGRVLNGSDLRDATKEIHAPKGSKVGLTPKPQIGEDLLP